VFASLHFAAMASGDPSRNLKPQQDGKDTHKPLNLSTPPIPHNSGQKITQPSTVAEGSQRKNDRSADGKTDGQGNINKIYKKWYPGNQNEPHSLLMSATAEPVTQQGPSLSAHPWEQRSDFEKNIDTMQNEKDRFLKQQGTKSLALRPDLGPENNKVWTNHFVVSQHSSNLYQFAISIKDEALKKLDMGEESEKPTDDSPSTLQQANPAKGDSGSNSTDPTQERRCGSAKRKKMPIIKALFRGWGVLRHNEEKTVIDGPSTYSWADLVDEAKQSTFKFTGAA
jgi:hypothetical protein